MSLGRSMLVVALAAAVLAGCAATPRERDFGERDNQSASSDNTQLGVQYLRRGELQQSLRKLQKAVTQDPSNADAYMMTGVVYERLEKPDLAREAFERAIDLDGKNSQALNNFGRFLCERGDYERATSLFERSADNPVYDSPSVPLTNAGICARRAGDTETAEDFLLRALKLNPRRSIALLHMAEIRYEADYFLSARGYYQRFLEVSRQTARSAWIGVRIEHELGDADAVASYEQLLTGKFPDSEQTRQLLEWERDGRL